MSPNPTRHAAVSPTTANRERVRRWASDVGWRIALTLVATVSVALGAWALLTTVFSAAAAIVVLERLVRHRGRGMLDAALVGVGAGASVLGLLGLLLDFLPGGITRLSWSIGVTVIAVVGLTIVQRGHNDVPPSPFRALFTRASVPTAIWSGGAAVILAVALLISVRSFEDTHTAPLDMSTASYTEGVASVSLTAGTDQGPFELDVVNVNGRTILATGITLTAGVPVVLQVQLPADLRSTVELVTPGGTDALRQLVFDTTVGAR